MLQSTSADEQSDHRVDLPELARTLHAQFHGNGRSAKGCAYGSKCTMEGVIVQQLEKRLLAHIRAVEADNKALRQQLAEALDPTVRE